MFLGHFAVALAAKRVAPKASLGVLMLGAQWADTLWPALLLTGAEKVRIAPGNTPVTPLDFESYPYSHSLVSTLGWGIGFAIAYMVLRRDLRTAAVLFALVASHWLLDWISHRPDMPIGLTDSNRFGLGLWSSIPATVAVELGLFGAGIWLYASATRAKSRAGNLGFVALAAVLVLIFVMNLASPPPPSVTAIAVAGLLGAIVFFAWGAWVDRHREPLGRSSIGSAPAASPR